MPPGGLNQEGSLRSTMCRGCGRQCHHGNGRRNLSLVWLIGHSKGRPLRASPRVVTRRATGRWEEALPPGSS